ncbi:ECF transporter S component [uncultured Clostridium sp.]|jgi:energy-coupling factor transport system substrate-specific component|uniref:ECF transporter S component n=1 Tax=uncultured Clostridium sp. TaxID=59620 RepID=UPI00261EEEDD|nr:ECF transporter S component [uncultured Clostridium sp.]
MKFFKTREIALIGMLSAFNIASRVTLQFLPNIKPVTSIIIMVSIIFGPTFGIAVAVVTTIVSNMLLGMGTWTIFQILAWSMIALLAGLLGKGLRTLPIFWMALFSAICGFIFGFFVSLDKLLIAGPGAFLAYYFAGLSFDMLHAIGNFAFYLICAPIFIPILKKQKNLIALNKTKDYS